MSAFPVLQSARLTLREFRPQDAPALFDIYRDAVSMQWFGSEPLQTLAQAEAQVALFIGWQQLPSPWLRWAVESRADQQLAGSCGLFKWNRGWRSCTLGYELAPAYRGQGMMREALQLALDWGFANMALNRIEAQVHPDNLPSIRLLQGLGFVQEGRLRAAGFWLGQYHDLLVFSLLRQDWAQPS